MTDWPKIIIDALKAYAGLSALVSTRVYFGIAPTVQAGAYVTAIDIGATASNQHGNAGATGATDTIQIQITAWSGEPVDAFDIRTQARLALDGKLLGTGSTVGVSFGNQFTTYDDQARLYGAILQLRLHVQH
jgi:hypothetical protein